MTAVSKWALRSVLPLAIFTSMAASERIASAQECANYTYHPRSYTNGQAGDIALTTAESGLVQGLTQTLGMSFGHSSMLYDNSGYTFTESTTGNNPPPSSHTTGEPHICSRVLSPYYLQRLSPGVLNATRRDARDGNLVKGGGAPYCWAPQDPYHINSIKFNDIHGGSCAAMNEADCGAAVQGPWQKTYSYSDHYAAADFLYQATYQQCLGMIDSAWPWHGIGCGGVNATGEFWGLEQYGNASGCDRASAQVVNEFATKGNHDCAAGVCDGWDEHDAWGDLLGGSKDNWQVGADWWNNYSNFTPRLPDNIQDSAGWVGHQVVGATLTDSAWWSEDNRPEGVFCDDGDGARTGNCDGQGNCIPNGYEPPQRCSGGGGPAMMKECPN